MKYWILIEVQYTGESGEESTEQILRHLPEDDIEQPFETTSTGIGIPSESGIGRMTFELDAKSPLLAMVHAVGMLRIALHDSKQEEYWDLDNAVMRVAPSRIAERMYSHQEPVLPASYVPEGVEDRERIMDEWGSKMRRRHGLE